MSKYVATINVPGYLPMDDDPPVFDTAAEAWEYLADERERGLDDIDPDDLDAECFGSLRDRADGVDGLDTPGTVYGSTPGYDGSHDLGLAYCVSIAEGED